MVCRHNFILDTICRAVNFIHSHFPALRKVAHNQNLSPLLMSLCQKNFSPKIFYVWILERLTKFTSRKKIIKYSKSSFCSIELIHLRLSQNSTTSTLAAASIYLSTSNPAATSSIPAATSSHPASSIPAATSNQPATTSTHTAAVPLQVASIQQHPSSNQPSPGNKHLHY